MRAAVAAALLCALPAALAAEATVYTEKQAAEVFSSFDVVVDVRSEAAYKQKHVKGAVLQSKAGSLSQCKNKKVAFYCSAGSASAAAANTYLKSTSTEANGGAYAIGTLDNLASAGVETETGEPDSHDPRCVDVTDEAAASEPPFALIAIVVVIAATFALALVMYLSRAKKSAPTSTAASEEEMTAAQKKLPPQTA